MRSKRPSRVCERERQRESAPSRQDEEEPLPKIWRSRVSRLKGVGGERRGGQKPVISCLV